MIFMRPRPAHALFASCIVLAPLAARAQSADVRDLPLVEVVAPQPSRVFAVLVSGDGGWAPIDRAIAGALQAHGVSVVGINAMKYLWRTRTPDGVGADLVRIVRHYLDAWHADSVVVIGYSRGAGVVPFMVNRMGDSLRARVRLVALLGAEHMVGFTFHFSELLTSGAKRNQLSVMPEIEKLGATPILCFYGADEDDTLCPELKPPHHVVKLPGGHHFDRDYAALGERIYDELTQRTGGRP
jgi:type IV secretory pathway VirJ component